MVFRVVGTITKVDNKPREEQYDVEFEFDPYFGKGDHRCCLGER
jgi:hypothetical protein